jgi:hypothetical protein
MTTPKQLKARFPYMFSGPHIGLTFYRGWWPVFVHLCADIDQALGPDKSGFHWTQLKEKFGVARWYFALGGRSALFIDLIAKDGTATLRQDTEDSDRSLAALRRKIQTLVNEATGKTCDLCILCGNPGQVDQHRGYLLTVCPAHAQDRRQGKFPSPWMHEEEP